MSVLVLNKKALVGPFNQQKALVGATSVIVKTDCETDGSSAALVKRLQLVPKHHPRPRLPVMTASMHPASTCC